MPLNSQLFSGDSKLEAAAVSDPAHIVPGAAGEHVRKIQLALIQLDGARLSPDGIYGPATAAAVLAYKQRRGIINRSYQSTPDNIVGKMTISALDLEMVARESEPARLQSLYPAPIPSKVESRGPILAFKFSGPVAGGAPTAGGPTQALIDLVQAPVNQQVVIAPNRIGKMQPRNFVGGVLVLSEPPNPNTTGPRVAKLINGTNLRTSSKLDNADIVADPETFNYQTFLECGIVKFQAVGPGSKKSAIADVLVLVDKSSYTDKPVYPADSAFSSGLVSVEGTPLNPIAGRRINIFGRGESNGFENYSTSIPYCNDSGNNTKPWTDDPRKPNPGIEKNSVKNICIRDSPIYQVTIDEIKRIAARGCRVTFSGPAGNETFMSKMRTELVDSGLARRIEDGRGKYGRTMVFEFQ